MSREESKFGKKKSGNKFNREKKYASSEEDILLTNQNQEMYKEERTKERHNRRVTAGLEEHVEIKNEDTNKDEEHEIEPVNKHDIKKYDSIEEAEKYLYHCHTCGGDIKKGSEFCSDKCKEYVLVYNYPCIWGNDCKMCKLSKRVKIE